MKKYLSNLVIVLVLLTSISTYAWDATGHIIVAQIAYDNLTPIAKKDIDDLFKTTGFSKQFPTFSPYIYSAPWPDYLNYDIKAPKGNAEDIFDFWKNVTISWHYINDPIVIGNFQPPKISPNNSVFAVQYLIQALSEAINRKQYNLAIYDLIFLTHIIGDIHQPLHSSTLYDKDFPNGDLGGNYYKIHSSFGATELHAAWDGSLGRFENWPHFSGRPGYHPPQSLVENTAMQFESACNQQANDTDPNTWEKEAHDIAMNFVYPMHNSSAPKPNDSLTQNYITSGQAVAAKQMCLAGKRLAAVLNNEFTSSITK